MPRVSVIIPAYNCEPTLRRAVESVWLQTFPDVETVIINDGSVDGTLGVARELQSDHADVVVVDQGNEGDGSARNRGLIECSGDYVAFLDSDDWYKPDYLTTIVSALENASADVAITGIDRINLDTGKVIYSMTPRQNPWTSYKYAAIGGKVCRREAIERARARFGEGHIGADIVFTARLNAACLSTIALDYRGYQYALTPTSLSETTFGSSELYSYGPLMRELVDVFRGSLAEKHQQKLVDFFLSKVLVNGMLYQRKSVSAVALAEDFVTQLAYLRNEGFGHRLWQPGETAFINGVVNLFLRCKSPATVKRLLELSRRF